MNVFGQKTVRGQGWTGQVQAVCQSGSQQKNGGGPLAETRSAPSHYDYLQLAYLVRFSASFTNHDDIVGIDQKRLTDPKFLQRLPSLLNCGFKLPS